ncbi:hypothetical protein [Pseudoalteromonas marina]|uniref:hypothetical protein n=1 Tax=Pseudoalteromonas marina TaxID=267375 RepID=UPI0027352CB4|nr:hypothetical protein [Pseudoalteromonas marina]
MKMKTKIIRYIGMLLLMPVIPFFFYAWAEYQQHAKLLLKDSSYNMPWEILYLNLFWVIPLSTSMILFYLAKNNESTTRE